MNTLPYWYIACALAPILLMVAVTVFTQLGCRTVTIWRVFLVFSCSAIPFTALLTVTKDSGPLWTGYVKTTPLSMVLALLVEVLGTVIGGFSARYLQGEAGQQRYIAALSTLLAAVHLLLMADHWLILISAWAFIGAALQPLLCFYPDRPFAMLAAHKKQIADRIADTLLIAAAAISWREVGSGSLSALWEHIAGHGLSLPLQVCAFALILAAILRTALLPVHGWLTQVMEAPTPVSALLHAGVVNLSGFVLIQFKPLLQLATPARFLLLIFGLTTAVLAGMVMLTRISIKVRLAWSTIAQMGFMMLECALGLYTFAALHLIGHSLYKAHAFLSASTVVRQTRLQTLHSSILPTPFSFIVAPILTFSSVLFVQRLSAHAAFPWWWSAVISLAWAPLLWLPAMQTQSSLYSKQIVSGLLMTLSLTGAAVALHTLPLSIQDAPDQTLGLIVLTSMTALYLFEVLLQLQPERLECWRRWSYAGFYVDEIYTRLALWLWSTHWTPDSIKHPAYRPLFTVNSNKETIG